MIRVLVVDDHDIVRDALASLLGDRAERERQAEAGSLVAEEMRGAVRRAVARLAAWKLWPPA